MVIQGASVMKSRPLRDDAAERRRRRRRTDPDERQSGLGQDSGGEHVSEPNDQRSEGIRQHMAAQHPQFGRAERPCGLDEFPFAHHQHGCADDAGRVGHRGDGQAQ